MTGLSLAYSDIPLDLIQGHQLDARTHERGGEREIQFHYRDPSRMVPIIHEGRLTMARWGTHKGESSRLPVSGWTWLDSVERGKWMSHDAAEVVIPARLGFDRGIWFMVREGARGIVLREGGQLVVYMIVVPASHYYQVMTRAKQMAALVGETI